MTQNEIIQDLLCFKGIINDYQIQLSRVDLKESTDNYKIMVSMVK